MQAWYGQISARSCCILAEARRLLDDPQAYAVNPYVDGRAAEPIVAALLKAS
jgi:UDP-N-acetylglucosamine 2-epimerase